jgi:hypothetical protein
MESSGVLLGHTLGYFPVFAKSKATPLALLVPSMLRNSSSLSRLLGLPTAVTLIPALTKRSDKPLPIPDVAPITSMFGKRCVFWNDVK